MGLNVHSIECSSDPNEVPTAVGQHWTNTNTGEIWFSVGTSVVGDWKKLEGDTDEKVSVSSNDSTPGYLLDKIQSGLAIDISEQNNGNDENLSISVNESEIDHTNISNIGVNSHLQIDSHISNTSNPHSVTLSQTIVEDSGTDISVSELESLSDGSNADALHTHNIGQLSGSHGDLSGLSDDDHTQYLTEARHDSLPSDNPHNVTASQVGAPPTGRQIIAGNELSGGGDLSTDRTINHQTSGVSAGSYTNADITVNQYGHVTSASNGTGGGSIFGSEFQEESSLGLSSTNSTTYQTKVTLTTPSIPSGLYRIGWTYSWSHNSTNSDFEGQLLMDGSTGIMFHAQEPQDAGTDQLHRHSGFEYQTLSSGVHTFQLQYSTEDSAVTAFIQRARLEFWRVS